VGNLETWANIASVVGLLAAVLGWRGANKRAEDAQQALAFEIKAHDATREALRLTGSRPRKPPVKRAGIIEGQRK